MTHYRLAERHLLWIVLMLGLNCGWTYVAAATTVYPTGSFPLDVQNVQAAIDLGGTVRLKATNTAGQPTAFNFGPPDPVTGTGVMLTTGVRLLGEQVGPHRTTIQGGYVPILGFVPVKTTIQGIDFDGPLDAAIVLRSSTGSDIIGNHIKGVVPFLLPYGFTETEGILVSGFDDPMNAITGRIRVTGNIIEISAGDFTNGLQLDEVSADIEVSGNSVQFLQSTGVIQTNGILVFGSHRNATVAKNVVTMGPGDPAVYPSGIFVGGHPEARYTIVGNTVITQHPNSDGMDIVGFRSSGPTRFAIVAGNHVLIHSLISTSGGIVFFGGVNNSLIFANKIEGSSGNAIQILGLDSTLTADSNLALANDISQLSASDADVFFGPDSTNNLYAGHCNTYVDLGVGNRILCGVSVGGSSANAKPGGSRPWYTVDVLADTVGRARLEAMRSRMSR